MKPEIIANIIAGFASVVALASFMFAFFSSKSVAKLQEIANRLQEIANQNSETQTLIAQGQLETSIREMLNNARDRVEVKALQFADISAKKTAIPEMIKIREDALNSVRENFLDCYNEACAKYRDNEKNKVFCERFKRLYENDIRKIVEKDEIYSAQAKQNSFQCIRAVAKDWFFHEK